MCFLFTNFLRNVVSDLIPGHMKPLGHHRKPLGGVTIFDDFPSPKEFYEDYVSKSQPFVVKGVLEKGQFPAYKLWTDKYLRYERGFKEIINTFILFFKQDGKYSYTHSVLQIAFLFYIYREHMVIDLCHFVEATK